MAAKHAGIVDENGGFFQVKIIGSINNYPASTAHGITSSAYSAYNGYSIHYYDGEDNGKTAPTTCSIVY